MWVPYLVAAIQRVIDHSRPDALLSTAPPFSLHLAACWVKRSRPTVRWVADYRDYWSPSVIGLRRMLSVHIERRCLRRADAAVFVNAPQRKHTLDALRWPNYDRAHIITNGFDADDFIKLRNRAREDNPRFQMVYAGSLLHDRMQTQLFPALDLVCADPDIRQELRVRILGNFADVYPDITRRLTEWGVLHLTPFAPQQTALEAIWDAGALLISEPDTPLYRANHSQKLFEYLASGNPILAVVPEGEIAQVIRQQQAGFVVHPDDRDGIANAIKMLMTLHRPHADGIEKNRRYERREIARQMAELLNQVTHAKA
jgi:glycosyltransferase involved in cell wall biosynthesis